MRDLSNLNLDKIQLIEGEIHVLSVMGFNKFELDDRVFPLSPKEYKYFEDKGYEVTYPNLVNKGYITWG
jgi:hypothetical protein